MCICVCDIEAPTKEFFNVPGKALCTIFVYKDVYFCVCIYENT